jgi:hypothetical protein
MDAIGVVVSIEVAGGTGKSRIDATSIVLSSMTFGNNPIRPPKFSSSKPLLTSTNS